jgi:hypothetical protein
LFRVKVNTIEDYYYVRNKLIISRDYSCRQFKDLKIKFVESIEYVINPSFPTTKAYYSDNSLMYSITFKYNENKINGDIYITHPEIVFTEKIE